MADIWPDTSPAKVRLCAQFPSAITGEGEATVLTVVWPQAVARTRRATMPTTRSMWSNTSRGSRLGTANPGHAGSRSLVSGRRAWRRGAPRMSDRIKSDLEAQCRAKLNRPELRAVAVDPIPEGHSGFTYFVTVDGDEGPSRYVLRLPPPGARIAGPADVLRQGRIMTALHAAGLPTPAIPAMSADPVVDGRPFILMEAVDGTRIEKSAAD